MSAPAPVDRDALCEAIVHASMRGQTDLVRALEAQYLAACVMQPEVKERDVRSIPSHQRNSQQKWEWAPPYDALEVRRQRGIDGATWAASLPEHEAQAAVFNRQRR